MLPVADDLLQVSGRVEEEMSFPLIPVHRHSAVHIDAANPLEKLN